MEVGAPAQPMITENIIQVENRAKVDKFLNETESKFIPNCSEQDTTIQSEDHNPAEDKTDTMQKTDDKSQEMIQPSISRVDDKDFILIEDADRNDDNKGSKTTTCETDDEETRKKIHQNFEKIKKNNYQIKAKTKKNSKREASTTTKLNDADLFSSLVVPDLGYQALNPSPYSYLYPQPFIVSPHQFQAAYDYSSEGAKQFMYNITNLPIQSFGLFNPMQMLLQNQFRQNLLMSSPFSSPNLHQVIIDANRKLNQYNTNDIILTNESESRKPELKVEVKPKEFKPAKDEKNEIAPELKKEPKKNNKNKRKQNFKAKVRAAASEENSEDSPQSEKEQPAKEAENDSVPARAIRKRRKFNRTGIILEPVPSEQKRVYEDYTFNIHFEDKVKDNIIETSVGPNFQAQIPDFELDEEELERPQRKVKLIWNPEEYPKEKIDAYFQMLKDNVDNENLHQERALKLFKKHDMDSRKLQEHMKKNRLYYKNYFEVRSYQSILRQKKSVH